MVRVVPRTIEEATTLFTSLPKGHWVAMIPEGRAGEEVACDLKRAATNSGCFIEKMIETEPSLTNAARFAKKILKNRPDVIFLWLDPATSARLAKGLRAAGYTGALAGPGRLRSEELIAADGATEGLVVPSPVLEKDAVTTFQHFADAFRARFGHDPDATAAAAYDAATLLICVLRKNADHPAREAFPPSLLFTGASGLLSFDAQGNRKSVLQLLEARGGRFVPRKSGANE
jgi:ABC-type branched-subunit amino acid transport system substrate-binding protein